MCGARQPAPAAGACWPRAAYWITGNRDGRAYLWNETAGAGVRSLAINMMGTQLAVTDKNGTTYVWNLTS